MLNPFPGLLTFTFFAPTLLRLAVSFIFFYLAFYHLKHKREVAQELSALSYEVALWVVGLYILIELAVAAGLLVGYLTQIVAIVGCALAIKVFFLKRSLHRLVPLSRMTYVLIAVICLSLLFTGAGALAFDVPL